MQPYAFLAQAKIRRDLGTTSGRSRHRQYREKPFTPFPGIAARDFGPSCTSGQTPEGANLPQIHNREMNSLIRT
jgi:hypothetical protein